MAQLPCVRAQRALLPEDAKALEVQRVPPAILRKARNDLRGFAHRAGQMANRAVDARELPERRQLLRSGPRPWHHPEVRMVHAASAAFRSARLAALRKLGGNGAAVEVDETFIGGKPESCTWREAPAANGGMQAWTAERRRHGHVGARRQGQSSAVIPHRRQTSLQKIVREM